MAERWSPTSAGRSSASSWKPTALVGTAMRLLARTTLERQALLEAHGETVLRAGWGQATLRAREIHEVLGEAGAPAH